MTYGGMTDSELDAFWKGVEYAEEHAEERIIKLLEHMPRTDNDRTVDAPTLIALIKGEAK